MLRKTIQATLIVMLMTEGVFAQLPPDVHLKRDKPEPTNLKKEHQKALDHAYRSAVKKIPEPEKNVEGQRSFHSITSMIPCAALGHVCGSTFAALGDRAATF
jgi:hypothetical protein